MLTNTQVLIGSVGLVLLALVAFAVYRWRQRQRVRQVKGWVKDHLVARYDNVQDAVLHLHTEVDEVSDRVRCEGMRRTKPRREA